MSIAVRKKVSSLFLNKTKIVVVDFTETPPETNLLQVARPNFKEEERGLLATRASRGGHPVADKQSSSVRRPEQARGQI